MVKQSLYRPGDTEGSSGMKLSDLKVKVKVTLYRPPRA
jgi:hypothetical protein